MLRNQHMARSESLPRPSCGTSPPLAIEKPKQARFRHQREFLKDLVDHFVVSQGRATVFQRPPVTRGKRRKKGVSSIVAGMVELTGFEPVAS